MKAHNNLYTTIGNISWFRWGAAALATLLVVAAGISLALLTSPAALAPVVAPAAPQAAPAPLTAGIPSGPSSKVQSPYDGSAYVEYLTGRAAAPSSNVPVSGTGSAYDGGAYGSAPAASYPSVPVVGTGSAYDGGAYGSIPAAPAQPSCLGISLPTGVDMSEISTGLSDYVRRCSIQQSATAQPNGLGIDLPAGAERSELPSGLTDYIRPSQ